MKKHIVFLLSDQHNPRVLGCNGDPYVRTPNIDRLAENGVAFDNCYCASPLCVPSRAALMSGRLPSNTGVFNNFQSLRSDKVTFAHCLSAADYETVLDGRMHFIGPDQRHGFEKHLVGDITPSFPGVRIDAFDDELTGADFPGRKPIEKAGFGYSNVFEFDSAVNKGAIDYLRTRHDPRPLFLTVGYFGPHCPYVCPKELYDYYLRILPEPEEVTPEYRKAVHPAVQLFYANRHIEDVSSEQTRRVRAAYYGMVEYLDGLVGEVLEEVDRTLGLENTVVLYASDHGDNLGENGVFWKTNFFDGSVRVPLFVSSSGTIPSNRREKGVVSLLDIGPTLIEYAKGPELPQSDGQSLLGILQGTEQANPARTVISQLADVKGDAPSVMARKRNWKLVIHAGHKLEQLYDVDKDPLEHNDLGADPQFAQVREELARDIEPYWDIESVLRQKDVDAKHLNVMRTWAQKVKIANIEHWQGDKKNNHVVTD